MKTLKRIFPYIYVIGIMLLLTGCTTADNRFNRGNGSEETEKGTFYSGTFYYDDYKIYIEAPWAGAPSGEAL